jgi:hypothetical protein
LSRRRASSSSERRQGGHRGAERRADRVRCGRPQRGNRISPKRTVASARDGADGRSVRATRPARGPTSSRRVRPAGCAGGAGGTVSTAPRRSRAPFSALRAGTSRPRRRSRCAGGGRTCARRRR